MGKKDKYRKIYEKYYNEAYKLAYFFTRDKAVSERITIEVFEELFEDVNYFMNVEKKTTWVLMKTKEKTIEILRREQRLFYFNEYQKEKHVAMINLEDVTKEQFKKIVENMKVEERYIFYTIYLQQKNIKEVAEELLVEEGTIKQMINKIKYAIDLERGRQDD